MCLAISVSAFDCQQRLVSDDQYVEWDFKLYSFTHSLTRSHNRSVFSYQSTQNVTWRNCGTNQITLRRFGNYNLFSLRVCSVSGLVQFFNSITTFKLIAT